MPGVPVRLAGDGLCMAVGEHRYGAGRGARFLLGIVVSTGVGGGLVLDGCGYGGRTGNAGHVGHVVVDPAVSRAPAAGAAVSRPCRRTGPGPVGTRQRLGRSAGCERQRARRCRG
ncbi:ROK family protein [Mycobacterium xenopi 3993]|nr:ROK family protein [Mycobacterium xenopi 3993]